jgi:DNA-binding NtrC family response regulator
VQGVPSAPLLRLNRHALSNILVVGGAPAERSAIAGALHRDSRLHGRPFCVTHAGATEALLRQSLLSWLGHSASDPSLACERGTLFVDDVCGLPEDIQQLLLALACRLDGVPAESRTGPGPSRLAAGCPQEPLADVASGRLRPELHDCLDKLTVHLGTSAAPSNVARGARGGSHAPRASSSQG